MVAQIEKELLAKQLGELKVTTKEKISVFKLLDGKMDRSKKKLVNVIMCKIFTTRKINPEVFKLMMPKIWNQEQTIIVNVGF